MKAMVDAGQLTEPEQAQLLAQATERRAEVSANLEAATAAGQEKKQAKLRGALEGLDERIAKLKAVTPVKHKLKHQSQIKKLRKELVAVDASMDPGRPMKMEKIQAQLDELEADAAEWFSEGDDRMAKLARSAEREAEKVLAAQAKRNEGFTVVKKKKK